MRRSEAVALWSIVVLAFLLPIFVIPANWMSVASSKLLLSSLAVGVALVAWTVAAVQAGVVRIPKSYLLYAAALVPLAYLVSALATGASRASFVGSGSGDTVIAAVILYALFAVSADILAEHERRLMSVIGGLFAAAGVLVAVQFLHLLLPAMTLRGVLAGQTASLIGSWHDLALFLGLVLFLALGLLPVFRSRPFAHRSVIAVAALSGLLLIIVGYGDVWLGVAALALLFALYLWRTRASAPAQGSTKSAPLWWVALALAAAGFFWGGGFVHGHLPPPLQVSQFEVGPSWGATWAVGQKLFSAPGSVFFGTGPNTFPFDWGLYKPVAVNATQFWNVDFNAGVGFIPTSVITVGVFGLVAWALLLVALAHSLVSAFFADVRSYPRFVFAAAAAYLTAFHIIYTPGPALSALMFLFFGLLVGKEILDGKVTDFRIKLSLETWNVRAVAASLSAFTVLVAFAGLMSVRAVLSDALVNRAAVQYQGTQDTKAASGSVSLALRIDPGNDRANRAVIELGMIELSQFSSQNDDAAAARLRSTLQNAISHGLAAVSIESRDYQNWLSLAYLYGQLAGAGVEGAGQNARAAYQQAALKNPTNPLPHLGLALLDLLDKNDAAARQELMAALQLKPDLASAHYLLSQIFARAGDLSTASQAAQTVVQLAPSDPLGWYNLGTILYAGGDYANAATVLERAVGLQNNYANALYLLGLSYYRSGRTDDALAAFTLVASQNPSDTALQTILTDLKAGKDPFKGSANANQP